MKRNNLEKIVSEATGEVSKIRADQADSNAS